MSTNGVKPSSSQAATTDNKPWPTRYLIDLTLCLRTPCHIGDGRLRQLGSDECPEFDTLDGAGSSGAELPYADTLVRDHGHDQRPCLPGSALKGVLRARAIELGWNPDQVAQLMGGETTPQVTSGPSPSGQPGTQPGFLQCRTAFWTDAPPTPSPELTRSFAPVPPKTTNVSAATTKPKVTVSLSKRTSAPTDANADAPQAATTATATATSNQPRLAPGSIVVNTRIAIDRDTRTVVDQKLFHHDIVTPGAAFQTTFILEAPNPETAQAVLANALLDFGDLVNRTQANPLQLGRSTRAGWGQFALEITQIREFGTRQMQAWWHAPDADPWQKHANPVDWKHLRTIAQGHSTQPTPPKRERYLDLPLTLTFEGPFAVRDPRYQRPPTQPNQVEPPHTQALADWRDPRRPRLPAASLLGSLRSQAERITRTLGFATPHGHIAPGNPANAVPRDCVSLLFGCTGWRGLLGCRADFLGGANAQTLDQDMIAICRITGGGQDGAKFKLQAWASPTLEGKLRLDRERCDRLAEPLRKAVLDLLQLVLRDLADGHISFGMGRSKGWGWLKPSPCPLSAQSILGQAFDQAYNAKPTNLLALLAPANASHAPTAAAKPTTPSAGTTNQSRPTQHLPHLSRAHREHLITAAESFHNPYHFIPFAKLPKHHDGDCIDTQAQLAERARELGHSHAVWRPGHHTGTLTVTLTTRTPLFIGGSRPPTSNHQPNRGPVEVPPFLYNNQRAIPGTSLRGMLSALFEPSSGSPPRILDDQRSLSVRMNPPKPDEVQHDKAGYPLKESGIVGLGKYPSTGQSVWFVKPNRPLSSTPKDQPIVTEEAIAKLYAIADERWQDKGKNISHDQLTTASNLYTPLDRRTKAFKKGMVDLLPVIDWSPSNPNYRNDLARRNPDHETLGTRARLQPGQVVYFRREATNKQRINEIAWSSVWRYTQWFTSLDPTQLTAGPLTIARLIAITQPRQLPLGLRPSSGLSSAEWLLGVVERQREGLTKSRQPDSAAQARQALAFASKISVSNALPLSNAPVTCSSTVTLRELSEPKPPSPALYLTPVDASAADQGVTQRQFMENPRNFTFLGTKFYLHAQRKTQAQAQNTSPVTLCYQNPNGYPADAHHGGRLPWVSHKAGTHRQVRVQPIAPEQTFQFDIRFDNLSDRELELLCATIEPSDTFEHRLGMGKPLGLGSVRLKILRLTLHPMPARYHSLEGSQVCDDPKTWVTRGQQRRAQEQKDVDHAIRRLGEPEHVQAPVHYPQVQNQPIEGENFNWWMENYQTVQGKVQPKIFLKPLK